MQKWMLIDKDEIETGDVELFAKWKQSPSSLLWIEIEGSAEEADKKLPGEMLQLPEAEIQHALRDRHPPSFTVE